MSITEDLEREVRRNFGGRCANCGSNHRTSPRLIVPEALGGQLVLTNTTLHCRTCDMRSLSPQTDTPKRRAINLWVSRGLYEWVRSVNGNGSTLVRALVELYLNSPPERFDDLVYYQDLGTDVRMFAYLYDATYEAFRSRVTSQGLTLTDGVTSLLTMYRREGISMSPPAPLQEPLPQ